MSDEVKIEQKDDLEKAIDRHAISGWDMGLDDDEDYIPVKILKQILDHFIPKWRRHEDRYYKLKKFATEQQLDTNISKIRDYFDKRMETEIGNMKEQIIKTMEFMDEFRAQATAVKKIIDEDKIAIERIRMRQKGGV